MFISYYYSMQDVHIVIYSYVSDRCMQAIDHDKCTRLAVFLEITKAFDTLDCELFVDH